MQRSRVIGRKEMNGKSTNLGFQPDTLPNLVAYSRYRSEYEKIMNL
jgi:hypothetical protein